MGRGYSCFSREETSEFPPSPKNGTSVELGIIAQEQLSLSSWNWYGHRPYYRQDEALMYLEAVFVAVVLLGLMVPIYALGYHRGKLRGMSERLRPVKRSANGPRR